MWRLTQWMSLHILSANGNTTLQILYVIWKNKSTLLTVCFGDRSFDLWNQKPPYVIISSSEEICFQFYPLTPFLDAIASLDLGYESKGVITKLITRYITQHDAIIECLLNIHWMYIEYTLKYCKALCNTDLISTLNKSIKTFHFGTL